jgi:surface-anchored protein
VAALPSRVEMFRHVPDAWLDRFDMAVTKRGDSQSGMPVADVVRERFKGRGVGQFRAPSRRRCPAAIIGMIQVRVFLDQHQLIGGVLDHGGFEVPVRPVVKLRVVGVKGHHPVVDIVNEVAIGRVTGDTDIAAVMEGDELVLEAFSEVLDQAVRAECVVFQASPATRVTVPEDPAFAFLGEPGSSAWIMPQNEEEGKLFLALAAEDIPAGIFQNDSVRITLKEFEGPGNLFLYQTDAFGQPAFFFDTSDGVSDLDFRDLKAGEHYHMNWAFTAPGTYVLGLQASGVRVSSGQPIESEVTHFRFEVVSGERPVLTISRKDEHTVILGWDSSLSVLDQVQSRSASTAGSWENLGAPFTGIDGVRSVEVAIETGISTLFFRINRRFDAE